MPLISVSLRLVMHVGCTFAVVFFPRSPSLFSLFFVALVCSCVIARVVVQSPTADLDPKVALDDKVWT